MKTIYSNPNKSQKEQGFFETFLSVQRNLNIDRWQKGESPDRRLYVEGKIIGLEVTTLVVDRLNEGYSLASIRSAQQECLQKATVLMQQSKFDPVEVKVKFSDYSFIDSNDGAKELVDFVKNKIPEIDDSKSWHWHKSGLRYSEWISIHLGTSNGHRWLDEHRFLRNHMVWMRRDPIDEIQLQLNAKQSKLYRYLQKCDCCWLLIGVDEWTQPEAVEITEKTELHYFLSDFQKVFFLKNLERRLIELKVIPRVSISK